MPNNTALLPIGPKYVLQGRVVTMGPQRIIPRGAIYIDSGDIVAVQRTVDPAPDGFENAPRINTGDSIYPGLIELHNHLSYNAMPLWDVPLKYTNSGQWKNHADYRRDIRIANPDTGGAGENLQRLQGNTCYLQHLSEGVDDTARNWFHRLRFKDGEWAVNDAFCGIHSTALNADDFEVITQRGGTMVWSPLSNFLLHGEYYDRFFHQNSG